MRQADVVVEYLVGWCLSGPWQCD